MRWAKLVREHLDVVSEAGEEFAILCPVHEDSDPSASANVRKGLWVCYACGEGGSLEKLLSQQSANFSSPPRQLSEVERQLEELEQVTLLDTGPRTYPEAWLDQFEMSNGYWNRRGLGPEAQAMFRLGWDSHDDSATIPIRDPVGRVLGVVRRRIDRKPKYLYPSGLKMHDYLFGAYEVRTHGQTRIAVTEGAIDAIGLWQEGVPAVALYGGQVSSAQMDLLRRLSPNCLVLAFDQDEAGEKGLEHMLSQDLTFTLVEVASWDTERFGGAKDIMELSPVDRRMVIQQARPIWD